MTLKQQLNSENEEKWDEKLNHLSFFGWDVIFLSSAWRNLERERRLKMSVYTSACVHHNQPEICFLSVDCSQQSAGTFARDLLTFNMLAVRPSFVFLSRKLSWKMDPLLVRCLTCSLLNLGWLYHSGSIPPTVKKLAYYWLQGGTCGWSAPEQRKKLIIADWGLASILRWCDVDFFNAICLIFNSRIILSVDSSPQDSLPCPKQ